MTPLAAALAYVMDEHDWTTADLARATEIPEPTMRGFTSGRVARPQRHQRAALDRTLAGGIVGTTRGICGGTIVPPRYPSDPLMRVCRTAQRLPADALTPLADFLERLS